MVRDVVSRKALYLRAFSPPHAMADTGGKGIIDASGESEAAGHRRPAASLILKTLFSGLQGAFGKSLGRNSFV